MKQQPQRLPPGAKVEAYSSEGLKISIYTNLEDIDARAVNVFFILFGVVRYVLSFLQVSELLALVFFFNHLISKLLLRSVIN
jgi:hypothetical protein